MNLDEKEVLEHDALAVEKRQAFLIEQALKLK